MGGGGGYLVYFLFVYFLEGVQFQFLFFPILKLLNDEAKATSNCRINFKLLDPPSRLLSRMRIVIFLFDPYFRCIHAQENQAVAWVFKNQGIRLAKTKPWFS